MFHCINADPLSGNFLTSRLDAALLNRARELRTMSFGFKSVLYQIEDREYSEAETNLLVKLLIETILPAQIEGASRAWKLSNAQHMFADLKVSVCSYKNRIHDLDDSFAISSMCNDPTEQRAELPSPVKELVAKLDELLDGSNWKVDFFGAACEFVTLTIVPVKEFHVYETDAEYEKHSNALRDRVMKSMRHR